MRAGFPDTVCLRVSRRCNASCGFCLAPSDGAAADPATLKYRVDWLLDRGVRGIHFCGGEPTIHPALPELLLQVQARNAKSKVTTNALEMSDELLAAFRAARPHVKVSLHGDRTHHDRMVGCPAFDRTVHNLRRLIAAGIGPSVQTTVVAEGLWVPDWVIGFCLQMGVARLTLLPVVCRGAALQQRETFELLPWQRSLLRERVKQRRRELSSRLDLRWVDIAASRIYVVEVDGRILLERGCEASDRLMGRIPPA